MKKLFILSTILFSLFISCKTTKTLALPIKPENLDSNAFIVNRVVLKSDTIEPSDEDLIQIFQSLPYNEIIDIVFEKKGLRLDMSLINETEFRNNIEYNVLCDAETEEPISELPEWEMNYETDEDEDQLCTLYFTMDPPDGFLAVQAVMQTTQIVPAKKEGKPDKEIPLQSVVNYTFDIWTYKNIFIDPRSCALIKFNKHITPTFIENELFSVYKVLNQTEDGYIAVKVKDLVEIRCNISDPGNLFSSPAEIYNASFTPIFQPGKKYMIKYKLKRYSPDSTKWKVNFIVKEEKPKLSK